MNNIRLITFYLLLLSVSVTGEVRLPKLISDGMVLQQNTEIKIWGWAAPHEKITVDFNTATYRTTTPDAGEWNIVLPKTKAGGPYTMTIKGANTIVLKDILIGDVWICSGQSNMELPMRRVSPIYESEIASSANNYIRCFTVPQHYNFNRPQSDFNSGNWQAATPEAVLNFSAVAYFFAKELYQKYKIPIGIINTSLGGSPAEAWVSENTLMHYPAYYQEMQRWKDSKFIQQTESSEQTKIKAWYDRLHAKDEGFKNPQQSWIDPAYNSTGWDTMKLPGYWANTSLGAVNGVVWFRKEIMVPATMAGQPAKLILGRIVDADSVFINGTFAGTTSYQYPPRRYDLPAGLIKAGKNMIVVRVISNGGQGGFVPDKQYSLSAGGQSVDLKGNWQYKLGAKMEPTPGQTFVRWKPGGLYNAMLAPLFNYKIKGAVWYQGEANTGRSKEYQTLLPDLIKDWRQHWQEGDFPFLFVQLPNFMEAKEQPSESNWALLREAQLNTLSVPNTGMAVTIDLGEWNDIHPLNKKEVGKRLALGAEKVAYNENNVYSGPIYRSMQVSGNKIILTFSNCGSGLISKENGELKEFAIAGQDGEYLWAKARIENNKVIVWNDVINHPVSVRYAWADNPANANLYNKEGLPASPFETKK
jgi:sialate O-acetylesterase